MNYQITSDNMQVSESMKEMAISKLFKLENRFKDLPEGATSARIVMNLAPVERFAVKIELDLNGKVYFTDETQYTMETALVNAVEELDRQIERAQVVGADWEEKREAKRFQPEDSQEVTE